MVRTCYDRYDPRNITEHEIVSKLKVVVVTIYGWGHTKETGNRNETAISENCRRFQAGNLFPDQQAHSEETSFD
jgi:hypothetical protein